MTREEAIRELTQWRNQMKSHGVPDYGKKLTALDLAIDALMLRDKYVKAVERMIEGAKEINRFLEEAAKKSDEKIVHELSGCDTESATTTDCISRQQAADIIDKYYDSVVPDFKTFCGVPIKEAIEVLEKYKHSPSVTPTEHKTTETMIVDGMEMEIDPVSYEVGYTHGQFSERPKGEWIPVSERLADRLCSECNYVVWDSEAEEYNFCPNCGAKMKGGTENE